MLMVGSTFHHCSARSSPLTALKNTPQVPHPKVLFDWAPLPYMAVFFYFFSFLLQRHLTLAELSPSPVLCWFVFVFSLEPSWDCVPVRLSPLILAPPQVLWSVLSLLLPGTFLRLLFFLFAPFGGRLVWTLVTFPHQTREVPTCTPTFPTVDCLLSSICSELCRWASTRPTFFFLLSRCRFLSLIRFFLLAPAGRVSLG